MIALTAPKAFVVAKGLRTAGTLVGPRIASVERHHRQLLKSRIQANASGAPGPEVQSGVYRNSIAIRGDFVGTDAPQAKRLEFGFVGPDKSGRHFKRRPMAHFGPAVDEIRPAFFSALERAVVETVNVVG